MTTDALDAFTAVVLADGALHDRLLAEPDRRRAVALLVAAAVDLGFDVTEADVTGAVAAARREWLERWV